MREQHGAANASRVKFAMHTRCRAHRAWCDACARTYHTNRLAPHPLPFPFPRARQTDGRTEMAGREGERERERQTHTM